MKICLIGSTRYMDDYHRANRELTLAGHIVYSVAVISTSVTEKEPITEDQKETLDLVHLRKIQESELVVIVGKASRGVPYLGPSTKRELKWATMNSISCIVQDDPDYGHLIEPIFQLCENCQEETTTLPRAN